MSAVTCGSPADDDDDREHSDASDLAFLASLPQRLCRVNARESLSRENLAARGSSTDEPQLSDAARRVWDAEKSSARALAERYRAVAELYTCEVGGAEPQDEDDIETLRAALALRVTHGVANWELRSAHHAVHHFPRTLNRLENGHVPSWWFARLLRTSQKLSDESRRLIDVALSEWSTDITAERFVTLLHALVDLMARREKDPQEPPAEPVRAVELAPDSSEGIGSITVRGPIPEILASWKALDETARALQAAQRKALKDETTIPFDVDEIVTLTGRPVPLGRLRYELQLGATYETDGVHAPLDRFRLNVTVPAMTLLGASDAPGMVDGRYPIPPRMARSLAGTSTLWHRVLTDPATGVFLPLPAERYHPDKAMLEHLRLRNATCAVPGCTRLTSWASEGDHLVEYNHRDPERGGQTEIENLHLLCWQHHLDKTLGLLDPMRLPSLGTGPGRTSWRIGRQGDQVIVQDDVDIATRIAVRQLERAGELHTLRRVAGSPPGPPQATGSSAPRIIPEGTVDRSPTRPSIPPGPWDPDDPPPF